MRTDREFNKMEMVSQRFSIDLISSISEHDAMPLKICWKTVGKADEGAFINP